MKFHVVNYGARIEFESENIYYLRKDNWDDYGYETFFRLIYITPENAEIWLGDVKIAKFKMKEEKEYKPNLPNKFEKLSDNFFSLGVNTEYYINIQELGNDIRKEIFENLNDIAYNEELYTYAEKEEVTTKSLLRFIRPFEVRNQFHRLALGGVYLDEYKFNYKSQKNEKRDVEPISINFSIIPNSTPPSNIHVLIGRNGVGKTHLINNMVKALVTRSSDKYGMFSSEIAQSDMFANIVSVSFSAFDKSGTFSNSEDKYYSYIGLKKTNSNEEQITKNSDDLCDEFGESAWNCHYGARNERWEKAINMLKSDSIFHEAEILELNNIGYSEEKDKPTFRQSAKKLFNRFSSGHKIILLTITRLVELIDERTLVFLDEPEGHLHPPLLSAFIRALSDLLIQRNGVAVIATHSPVVLQEVPKRCVWKIRRFGHELIAERPEIETFGENVGVLTREIFGLEVTESGYHKMLKNIVAEHDTYEEIIQLFNDELGMEAKAMLRVLLHLKK